jgi:hypothetical protein
VSRRKTRRSKQKTSKSLHTSTFEKLKEKLIPNIKLAKKVKKHKRQAKRIASVPFGASPKVDTNGLTTSDDLWVRLNGQYLTQNQDEKQAQDYAPKPKNDM